MGRVLSFPLPKRNVALVCPECRKNNWQLLINDRDEEGGFVTMFCRTRNCGHAVNVELFWGEITREEGA